jgi:hypothetical protein
MKDPASREFGRGDDMRTRASRNGCRYQGLRDCPGRIDAPASRQNRVQQSKELRGRLLGRAGLIPLSAHDALGNRHRPRPLPFGFAII